MTRRSSNDGATVRRKLALAGAALSIGMIGAGCLLAFLAFDEMGAAALLLGAVVVVMGVATLVASVKTRQAIR